MTRQAYKNQEKRLAGRAKLMTTTADSARMARVRRTGTAPEQAVRKVATALGLRYRLQNSDLPGTPDLANRRRKFAVFVHGCFWHGHGRCAKASIPKRNRVFWKKKLSRNKKRDRQVVSELGAREYRVAVVWECECVDPALIAGRLQVWLPTLSNRTF